MARRRSATTHGVCVVDKPAGVTSHDVVAMLRKRFGERQIGHGGTLDPGATGVLVVGVGMATKLLRFVESTRKSYEGDIVFGAETSTLDADGEVTKTHEMAPIDLHAVRDVIAEHLTGSIEQIPPMVSAVKIDGKRLHELAREGIEVDRPPRPVTIHRFDVAPTEDPMVLRASIDCSAGTYIRTLASDLGSLLGGGAHLRSLRRTAVGEFGLDRAAPPDVCELLPVQTAVAGLTTVSVSDDTAAMIANGRVLDEFDGDGPWAVVHHGNLLAVYEPFRRGLAKPSVVLPTAAGR